MIYHSDFHIAKGGAVMSLQESGEMYLETIFILSKKGGTVRAIDICEHMGFSKPSVSRALSLLKSGGYVTTDEDGHLRLTKDGDDVARKMYERHNLIADFLVSIGVDRDTATEDACKIEHDISEVSFNAIKKHAERLREL